MDRCSEPLPLVCRIKKGGYSPRSGSGVIAEINPQLLEELSCLRTKFPEAGNVFKSPSYVLLTAHSNVYDKADENVKDEPVAKYIDKLSVVLGNSVELPLSECVLFVEEDDNRRGLAVSCCGVDSILLSGVRDVKLDYTLRAHGDEKCCIDSNFLILFLNAEVLKRHIISSVQPQRTDVGDHDGYILRWCDEEGALKEQTIDIHVKETNCSGMHGADPRPEHSLAQCIEGFRAQQNIDLVSKESINPCCIGAPIVTPDGSSILGIYVGGRVTTVYGIFELLKGGLVQFLSAMIPEHSSARTLMPSRWEAHVVPFISGLNSLSSLLDLLHHLLYHGENASMRILSCNLAGGPFEPDIVSGLKIYTEIFKHYGKLVKELPHTSHYVDFEHSGKACKCFGKIKDDMREISKHFATLHSPPVGIVKALFECFEAMQEFTYEDMEDRTMAADILEENRLHLDVLAMKENIDPLPDVNRCFKLIDILNRQQQAKPRRERSGSVPQPATNGD